MFDAFVALRGCRPHGCKTSEDPSKTDSCLPGAPRRSTGGKAADNSWIGSPPHNDAFGPARNHPALGVASPLAIWAEAVRSLIGGSFDHLVIAPGIRPSDFVL